MIDKNNLTSTQIILPQNYVLSIPSYDTIDLVFLTFINTFTNDRCFSHKLCKINILVQN